MKNRLNDICLVFSENPIARAYLYLFLKEDLISNKIIYLNSKFIFNKFFLKLNFNTTFNNTKKYLKSNNVLEFIKNIEKYFNLSDNFLIEMYNFENIFKFKNFHFAKSSDINNYNNIEFFKSLEDKNFLNTTNKILKNILDLNKNFYHIHPGYLYQVRGADASLNSIKYFNEIGASFYLMDKKIDTGKIIKKFKVKFDKIFFPNNDQFNNYDLYQIWFSFFDPALRVMLLKKMLDQNMNLDNFETINMKPQDNNYYSFIKKEELKKLFNNKIFI
tara:strand:+ start:6545 stop:7366 length:822 start_codon:yes stop_codon:yes gene_type:complete